MDTKAFIEKLKFNSDEMIPAVIQEESNNRVLTLCYMTKEALQKTLNERYVYVFRRSLGKLMKKGETSGHVQEVKTVERDCEGKSLLIRVSQKVAGCHKGYFSCYFEEFTKNGDWSIGEEKIFDPEKVY